MPSKRWIIHRRPRRPDFGHGNQPQSSMPEVVPQGRPSQSKPAIYHCVNRVVDRRFVFGDREKDKFIEYMRMYEAFTGVRILAYCVMSNHFHLMVEIPPMPEDGISDENLLNRLAAIYDEATVDAVEIELQNARHAIAEGRANERRAEEIRERYTYRMHDLSEFMKSLVQRFTQWHNRRNERKGNLWEDAFRSIVVEPGVAARLVAAYIDLNPVRAGIVADAADYPWSSYGEASANKEERCKKPTATNLHARAGLVRAFFAHQDGEPDPRRWKEIHEIYRPWIEQAMERVRSARSGQTDAAPTPGNGETPGSVLAGRIRHFTDGVAIGSRGFINAFFIEKRDRFGSKRITGARPIRGRAAAISKIEGICCLRDLQKHLDE